MKRTQGTVEVNVGKEKFTRPYEKVEAETREELIAFIDEDLQRELKYRNYAADLEARSPIRTAILNNEAQVSSIFEKQVKDIMKQRAANKRPVTEEQARKIAEMMQSVEV